MKPNASPDSICGKFSLNNQDINIDIKIIDDVVVVEGEKTALEFLSQLFKACSTFEEDCGFQMSPQGAGSNFFSKKSKFGLYIHRANDPSCTLSPDIKNKD